MEIKAKFIGANSLGYENGKTYHLKIVGASIQRIDGSGTCFYNSLKSFLSNWENIKIEKR